jgi:hypothetical protein
MGFWELRSWREDCRFVRRAVGPEAGASGVDEVERGTVEEVTTGTVEVEMGIVEEVGIGIVAAVGCTCTLLTWRGWIDAVLDAPAAESRRGRESARVGDTTGGDAVSSARNVGPSANGPGTVSRVDDPERGSWFGGLKGSWEREVDSVGMEVVDDLGEDSEALKKSKRPQSKDTIKRWQAHRRQIGVWSWGNGGHLGALELLDGIAMNSALLLDELPKLCVLAGEHVSLREDSFESERGVAIYAGESALDGELWGGLLTSGGRAGHALDGTRSW